MSQQNVVVIGFTEPSKAYQALSVLKACDADGRIGLESAAVVERTTEGALQIPESADNDELVGMASGSVVGMLIGVLGGPVGVLLGWGAGAMMGGAFDLDRAITSDEALTVLGTAIPAGSTAVIANVEEPAVEVIDGEMAKLGGEVTRRPVDRRHGRAGRGRGRSRALPSARRARWCGSRRRPSSTSTLPRRRRSCRSPDLPAAAQR